VEEVMSNEWKLENQTRDKEEEDEKQAKQL
jgi:hypothetical protein